jgi:hypothetical protein
LAYTQQAFDCVTGLTVAKKQQPPPDSPRQFGKNYLKHPQSGAFSDAPPV